MKYFIKLIFWGFFPWARVRVSYIAGEEPCADLLPVGVQDPAVFVQVTLPP